MTGYMYSIGRLHYAKECGGDLQQDSIEIAGARPMNLILIGNACQICIGQKLNSLSWNLNFVGPNDLVTNRGE